MIKLLNNKNVSFGNVIFLVFLFLIVLFSLFFRTYIFVNYSAGFYCDECFLTINFLTKTFLELFLPLDHSQCCPPIFLILAKIVHSFGGFNEFNLRLIPFYVSLFSVFTFIFLTFLYLKNKISIIFANLLFAFSQPLILYSILFKHYSFDVFASILILIISYFLKDKILTRKQSFLLGVFSAVFALTSYTSIFIIITSLFSIMLYKLKNNKLSEFCKNFIYFFIPFSIFMIFYFIINCLPIISNSYLQIFWHHNSVFEIFFPTSIQSFKFLVEYLFLGIDLINPYVVLFFLVFVLVFSFLKNKFFFFITVLPFILASILGVFDLYPFAPDRVSLYLIPVFILLISKTFDSLSDNKNFYILTLFISISMFNYQNFKYYIIDMTFNHDFFMYSTTKNFVELLYKSDINDNDYIWGDYTSFSCFEVYDSQNKLNKKNIRIGWDLNNNREQISKIPAGSNIFFYISDRNVVTSSFKNDIETLISEFCEKIYYIPDSKGIMIKCRKR